MSRTSFDQFSKQFLEEFLTPFGEVQTNREVPGEPRFIDIFFAPSTQPSEESLALGLLGKIVTKPCLLEPFRNQPSSTEVRSCLFKLLFVQADFQRKARREDERILEVNLPQLWILAPSASESLLNGFGARLRDDWLPGVYFLANFLKTAIIAINQLPRTEETLWVRLLGKGATQKRAIEEILALPSEDSRRSKALRLLASWKITMEVSGVIDEEDRDLLMTLSPAYLQWEQETEQRGQRLVVENLLKVRFGALDEQLSAIIPALLELPAEEYTRLLLQLSREELLSQFQHPTS
jgi:hypothetical protein